MADGQARSLTLRKAHANLALELHLHGTAALPRCPNCQGARPTTHQVSAVAAWPSSARQCSACGEASTAAFRKVPAQGDAATFVAAAGAAAGRRSTPYAHRERPNC